MKILVAAHKPYEFPADELYLPVQVGAALSELDLGIQKDNEGENISDLNGGFCELTALYWGWKNLDEDFLGLVHYRRQFALTKGEPWQEHVLTAAQLVPLAAKYPVVVPAKRKYYIETLYSHYAHTHHPEELDLAERILLRDFPDFAEDYQSAVHKKSGYMFNMMILRRDYLEDYCGFLFPLLFALQREVGERNLSAYENRFFGRVSEILFNVWLANRLRTGALKRDEVFELPWISTEPVPWGRKISAFLQAKFLGKKYAEGF